MLKLNSSNYFSREANEQYMSVSQFKSFLNCEAAALAEIRGEYERPMTQALLIGSYVDSHFDGTLDIFKAQHPEVFKRDGSLKSEYLAAEEAINRAEQDELFMLLMSGKKQVIKTSEINGIPFKTKIDSLLDEKTCVEIVRRFPETAEVFGFCEGAIVDLKYVRDVEPIWKEGEGRVSFVEYWGYDIQGAAYQDADGQMLPFILAVITKETPAGIYALSVEQADLTAKLMEIEELAPRFQAIKEGLMPAERCEKCAFCRQTKVLQTIIDYKKLRIEDEQDE